MFGKIANKEKKEIKAKQKAMDVATAQSRELAELGWQIRPIITHPNPSLPHIVHAVPVLVEVTYKSYEDMKKQNGEAKIEELKPEGEADAPTADTGAQQTATPANDTANEETARPE